MVLLTHFIQMLDTIISVLFKSRIPGLYSMHSYEDFVSILSFFEYQVKRKNTELLKSCVIL